jgi:hypothetical protein
LAEPVSPDEKSDPITELLKPQTWNDVWES